MTPFEKAFEYLIENEGEDFVLDVEDSGGATRFGITKKAYENFLGMCIPDTVIKELTKKDAMEFYHEAYWDEMCLDEIANESVQICLFDSAVLYGLNTATILAQKAASICGATLKFDGIMGDKTLEAINLIASEQFIKSFHQMVMTRINAIVGAYPKNQKFVTGWKNRADKLLKLA